MKNAHKLNDGEMDVLKKMVIMPNEDSDEASFEVGEGFYAEGALTQVMFAPDVYTGNFTFEHPVKGVKVEGKWVSADPLSKKEAAKHVLKQIHAANKKAAKEQGL